MVFNKFSPRGYFGGNATLSRGPWFNERKVEDDGLERYYKFKNDQGETCYLLSNNLSLKDRESFASLYKSSHRVN